MKKLGSLITILFCLNINAQKGNGYICSWNSGSVEESEIPSANFSCDKKGKICYFIANDKDNILLSMRIEDVAVQNRILKEGFTVWISMDGKQTRDMGVRYPIGSQRMSGRGRAMLEMPKTNPDGTLATPLTMANTIELIGFSGETERRLPAKNADSFNGFVKYDKDGILHYRLVMPVAKVPVRNSKDSNGPMPFILGLEYGEGDNQRPSGPPPAAGGGGAMPAGGGGGRGGQGGGGMPGGGAPGGGAPGGRPSASDATAKPSVTVWIKNVTLASGQ